jgi:hypothetical protein
MFKKANSELMRIDSSGNVGIGTSSPNSNIGFGIGNDIKISQVAGTAHQAGNAGSVGLTISDGGGHSGVFVNNTHDGTYSDQSITFKTAEGGISAATERMTITSAGNVGIGTSSPSLPLHINGSSAGDGIVYSRSGTEYFRIDDTGTDMNIKTTGGGHTITFNTSGSERMRIDSSGNLLVGTATIYGQITSQSDGTKFQYASHNTDTSGATQTSFRFMRNTADVGSITTTSSATAYNTSSDYRLKENVVADWDATTRLKQLNPVRFNFISNPDTTVDGFLAHEVQDVVPEAITGTHNEVDDEGNPVYQGIDQSKLVPLLVKTIQELEARIAALEAN